MQDVIRHKINQTIIESLKESLVPWRRPWINDPNAGLPVNIVSRKTYNGINPLLLELSSIKRNYKSKWWGTYEQWRGLGGQVQKRPTSIKSGDWGTSIIYWRSYDKKIETDGVIETKKTFFMKTYTVFNLDQVDGHTLDQFRVKDSSTTIDPSKFEHCTSAENVIAATKADIHFGGNMAFYMRPTPVEDWPNHKGGDFIRIPNKNQFTDPAEFYVTQFHELIHFSEIRLGWTGFPEMGELIAEIGACYLAAETGVPNLNMENHKKYLAYWLKEMESDPKWIFLAATQASKAADYILSFSQKSKLVGSDELFV